MFLCFVFALHVACCSALRVARCMPRFMSLCKSALRFTLLCLGWHCVLPVTGAVPLGSQLRVYLGDTWGDNSCIGLTSIEVLDDSFRPLPLRPTNVKSIYTSTAKQGMAACLLPIGGEYARLQSVAVIAHACSLIDKGGGFSCLHVLVLCSCHWSGA